MSKNKIDKCLGKFQVSEKSSDSKCKWLHCPLAIWCFALYDMDKFILLFAMTLYYRAGLQEDSQTIPGIHAVAEE